MDGETTGGLTISRNPGAKYWIPSEDEWYKAAYHQPSGEGGDSDDYWLYPTGSNTLPGNEIGPLPLENHANIIDESGNYSVTEESDYDSMQNYLTDGGTYEGSASPYGTFDQGGNVWEWNDAVISDLERGLRGGWWNGFEDNLRSSDQFHADPADDEIFTGFRVASP